MPLDTISEHPSLENLFRQLKENAQNAPAEIAIYCEANTKYEQIAALLKQIETAGENIDQIRDLVGSFLDTRDAEKDTIERAQQSAFDIETQIFLYHIYNKLIKPGNNFQNHAEETLDAIQQMVLNLN